MLPNLSQCLCFPAGSAMKLPASFGRRGCWYKVAADTGLIAIDGSVLGQML